MNKIILALAMILAFSPLAEAKINSISLYNDGAIIECEELVTPEADGTLKFRIPYTDISASFDVVGHNLVSVENKLIEAKDTPKVLELIAQKEELVLKSRQLDIARQESYLRNNFLSEQLVKLTNEQNIEEKYQYFLDKLSKDTAYNIEEEHYKLNEQISALYNDIDFWSNSRFNQFELTVRLDEAVTKPVQVFYSYADSASWEPNYIVKANEKEVELILHAHIKQSSATDWKDLPVTFMAYSMQNNHAYIPKPKEWVIMAGNKVMPRALAASPMQSVEAKSQVYSSGLDNSLNQSEIAQTELKNAVSYSNIKVSCASQNNINIILTKEKILAKILRLAVPYTNSDVYLTANLELDSNKYYLPAPADVFYDAKNVGKTYLDFSSQNNKLSLGIDPLVEIKMKRLDEQAGKSGLIDKKQTYTWNWSIDINNMHSFPIDIQVEDAAPQKQIQNLELQVQSKPNAILDDNNYIWRMNIPANTKEKITHSVNISAPLDLQIYKGR